jgi:hypothetical protein
MIQAPGKDFKQSNFNHQFNFNQLLKKINVYKNITNLKKEKKFNLIENLLSIEKYK